MSPGFNARNLHGTIFSVGIARSACSIRSEPPFTTTALQNSSQFAGRHDGRIPDIHLSLFGLRADVQHVVASDEGITILVLQLTIDVLLSLLHGEVHVAILR